MNNQMQTQKHRRKRDTHPRHLPTWDGVSHREKWIITSIAPVAQWLGLLACTHVHIERYTQQAGNNEAGYVLVFILFVDRFRRYRYTRFSADTKHSLKLGFILFRWLMRQENHYFQKQMFLHSVSPCTLTLVHIHPVSLPPRLTTILYRVCAPNHPLTL